MKMRAFASRNFKEITRDKLTVFFGIGFPILLILLMSAIQAHIPVDLFAIERLAPGVAVFGLSFIALFSGLLISKDRTTSFMMRLFTSPLTPFDFIAGYILPLFPISLLQSILCFVVAFCLKMKLTAGVLLAIAVLIPTDILFIGIGLLCGTFLNDKQVGGVCGALLTNVCGWMSGTWFDIELVGGGFKKAAELLPFIHAVNAARAAVAGNYGDIFPDLYWVVGYAAVMIVLAVFLFSRKMKNGSE
ncbi:MAG: ABC transporter permease [Clostridiales bacterium]|nr:ABC transporter permease [Clostridiales bacterium]